MADCSVVEPCATTEHGEFCARDDICDALLGVLCEARGIHGGADWDEIEAVEGCALALRGAGFIAADGEVLVDLHGINVDDFGVAQRGEEDAEGCFS